VLLRVLLVRKHGKRVCKSLFLSFEHNEEKWLSSVLLLKATTLTNICRYESTAESDSLT